MTTIQKTNTQKMAIHRPDYKLQKAEKIIAELGDSEKDQAIKYYISNLKNRLEKANSKNKEYHEFFRMLDTFMPRKNLVMGGKNYK
jgi:hypothetical protein